MGRAAAVLTVFAAPFLPVAGTAQELRTLADETTLRESPDPSAATVAVLGSGAPLEVVGESSAGWIEVRVPGSGADDAVGTAFVSTSQVEWVAECSPSRPATLRPGDTFRDCLFAPEMMVVPAGRFTMGTPESEDPRAPDEGPQREVTIAAPFAIGVYEVTYEEWETCVLAGPCRVADDDGFGQGRWPIVNLNWNVAQVYLEWLSEMNAHRYRLPSEAEWEYAARAGVSAPQYWDGGMETVCEHANVYDRQGVSVRSSGYLPHADCEDGFERSSPVGSYMPNAFGLYDVIGNATEWVSDCYLPTYEGAPVDGSPRLRDPCPVRVMRGGGYYWAPYAIRLGYRQPALAEDEFSAYGIRVVTDLSVAAPQDDRGAEVRFDRSSAHELDRAVEPLVPPDQAWWEVLAEAAVRQSPHPDSPVGSTLAKGTPLDVVRELPSWFEVATEGEGGGSPAVGYVARSDAAWTLGECAPPDEEAALQVGAGLPRLLLRAGSRGAARGPLIMGSPPDEPGRLPEDRPQREETVEAPFAIGVYEVTQREWTACMRAGGCNVMNDEGERGAEMPQSNVTWFGAQEYLAWLSEVTGRSYRLPTEVEWEYAARGGTQTVYWWGDDTADICTYENIMSPDWESPYTRFLALQIAPCRDGYAVSRRWGHFSPTASASTTSRATSASGSRTATPRARRTPTTPPRVPALVAGGCGAGDPGSPGWEPRGAPSGSPPSPTASPPRLASAW